MLFTRPIDSQSKNGSLDFGIMLGRRTPQVLKAIDYRRKWRANVPCLWNLSWPNKLKRLWNIRAPEARTEEHRKLKARHRKWTDLCPVRAPPVYGWSSHDREQREVVMRRQGFLGELLTEVGQQ